MEGRFIDRLTQVATEKVAADTENLLQKRAEHDAQFEARWPGFREANMESWQSELEQAAIDAVKNGRSQAKIERKSNDAVDREMTQLIYEEIAKGLQSEGLKTQINHRDNGHFETFMGEEGPYVPATEYWTTLEVSWDPFLGRFNEESE